MVTEIRIYFEGDPRLREGFHHFLRRFVQRARGPLRFCGAVRLRGGRKEDIMAPKR